MMNAKELDDFLLSLPESELDFPFGKEVAVYKVVGKMFALVSHELDRKDKALSLNLKGLPADNMLLSEEFESIRPGYHMNKKHWITVVVTEEIGDGMLKDLIERSYDLVVKKLKKADRERIAISR